jgi:hypothetical protein
VVTTRSHLRHSAVGAQRERDAGVGCSPEQISDQGGRVVKKRERLAVFGIVLAGSSLGFLAGVLTAPRAGRKTRRRLARRMEEERKDLMRRGRDSLRDAGEALEERLEDGKRVVSRAMGA